MQYSSAHCLSDIFILSWSLLYADYGQKCWSLKKIQYLVKYTIKVATKIFLKVSALPLLENLIQEKQSSVAIHQTRTWPVQLRISLSFSHVTRNPTASWRSITKLTLRKRWDVALQVATCRLDFLACFHVCRGKIMELHLAGSKPGGTTSPTEPWAEAAAGCSSGSRMLSRFVSVPNEA